MNNYQVCCWRKNTKDLSLRKNISSSSIVGTVEKHVAKFWQVVIKLMKEIGLLASQGIVKPDFYFNVGINFDFLHFRQINFRDPRDLFELSKHPIASHHVTERSFSTPHATQD